MKKISGLKSKLQTLAFSTRTYQNWLSREEAEILRLVPVDIWPGQAQLGQACLTDDFGLGPESGLGNGAAEPMLFELHRQGGHSAGGHSAGGHAGGSGKRNRAALGLGGSAGSAGSGGVDPRFHDGAWLRDLRALGGDEARRRARALIGAWLDRYANWEPEAWALPMLGARISNWLALHDFVLASADDAFRARVFASLASQTRHLSLALPASPTAELAGYQFVRAVKGLIYGGLCLDGLESYGEKGLSLLLGRLDTLLARDGLVRERAPSVQLAMLRDLVDIRGLLRQDGIEVPPQLSAKIDAMAPALRCVRYGDGGLALFHGGDEGQGVVIEALLQQTGTRARAKASLPESGFERITAGRACLLVDAGLPPEPGYDGCAHAALGAFEFSIGRERLLVNCGTRNHASAGFQPAWRQALAASAAHNAAIIRDTNMIEVRAAGNGSGLGARPSLFAAERTEQLVGGLKNTRVTIEHNAYAPDFGIVCRRQLDLQADGQVLAGLDELRGAIGLTFAIRFHLHPSVQVSLIQDSRAALLKLPSGQGWRLRAPVVGAAEGTETPLSALPLALAASIYAGDGLSHRPTRQLVIEGKMTQDQMRIGWVFSREG